MCSITGFIEKKESVNLEVISRMNTVLCHRGPDDSGIEIVKMFGSKRDNVAVAHNRLSIWDLSPAGHQPMCNSDRSVIIIFNGEIYNADDFRKEICDTGYNFQGTSDTEVLLQLYIHYGMDLMLSKIDGMYTMCILDVRKDCIYLVRDKIGEKPLYYYENSDVFMWASEYKAFYEHPSFIPALKKANLTEYLMFRYIAGGGTLLEGVKNLTPGSYLKITNSGIAEHKYWDFPYRADNLDDTDTVKRNFIELLNKAYKSRMVSDVEIGIQLSGGVDSSCLTEYVSRVSEKKIKTFGIVFDGRSYSEEKYMKQVVKQCNIEPYMYNFTNELFLNSWLNTTYFFEMPMNHEGTLGLFYLNKKASDKVKVILCGEGADETGGGYYRFYDIFMCKSSLKYRIRKITRKLLINHQLDKYVLKKEWDTVFVRASQYVDDREVKKIYGGEEIDRVVSKRLRYLEKTHGEGMRKLMNYETTTYCQDLLMRADKVSMASSVEQRVPYLMPQLVEFLCRLPDSFFVAHDDNGVTYNTKKLLKEYCSDLFGEPFAYRPKMGFGISLEDYFSVGEVRRYIEDRLLPGIKRRGIFNYIEIEKTYLYICRKSRKFVFKRKASKINVLWTVFSFEMWAQMYLDGNPNIIYRQVAEMQK